MFPWEGKWTTKNKNNITNQFICSDDIQNNCTRDYTYN